MLNTDQTTTLIKVLTIFIENRDPFTIESIVNEIKRSGDLFDGFHDEKGECNVEDYYLDISEAVDNAIKTLYNEWVDDFQTVYVFRPAYAHPEDYEDEDWDDDDYDEIEDLDEDEYETDKEGNKLPPGKVHYDVKIEDDGDGRTTYSLKPRFDEVDDPADPPPMPGAYRNANGEWTLPEEKTDDQDEEKRGPGWYKDPATGEWDWDRDAAESARYEEGDFENYGQEPETNEEDIKEDEAEGEWEDVNTPNYSVNDHPVIYDFSVDNTKRVNFGKKFLVKVAGYNEDDTMVVIGVNDDPTRFYIIKSGDNFELGDNEYIVGEYKLKNGALRLSIAPIIPDIQPGEILHAQIHWPVMCTDDNLMYIYVYVE